MNAKKRIMKIKSLFLKMGIFLLLFCSKILAQQYPVRISTVMIPPHSLKLHEYATMEQEKLRLSILMTDLEQGSQRIKLHFSLENASSSLVAASVPYMTNPVELTLFPGSRVMLSNLDLRSLFELQNLSGISPGQYASPLKDGLYRFCFKATDVFTERDLSMKSCATVYLVQYDPPMLNLPRNKEKITKTNEFQRIVFQWMARQYAPNTKYIFTLKEIYDTQRDPISGFISSPTLFEQEVVSNSLFYGPDKPYLFAGRRYAWQVRAISGSPSLTGSIDPLDNSGVYKNNGRSEIFYFDYTENCPVPRFLGAENSGRGKMRIRWSLSGLKPPGSYRIEYRKKDFGIWQDRETYTESILLSGLEENTEYEYRVGSVCGEMSQYNSSDPAGNAYTFSGVQYFKTPSKEEEEAGNTFQCGVMPAIDLSNKNLLTDALARNEVFMAGDFPVTVLYAEGNNGNYSGEGFVEIPYLEGTKIKVRFKNISLNTDKRLIAGVVETTYDPTEKNVTSLPVKEKEKEEIKEISEEKTEESSATEEKETVEEKTETTEEEASEEKQEKPEEKEAEVAEPEVVDSSDKEVEVAIPEVKTEKAPEPEKLKKKTALGKEEKIKKITEEDFEAAAKKLGVEVASIKAVYDVEVGDEAFRPNGDPKVLFERHIFSQKTNRRYDNSHPDISNANSGGYGLYSRQISRLKLAVSLDKEAGYMSASYSGFQIMGFHYESLGYDSAETLANLLMSKDEGKHLEIFVKLLDRVPAFKGAKVGLQKKDWAMFAKIYNGPEYKSNNYDIKLKNSYHKNGKSKKNKK